MFTCEQLQTVFTFSVSSYHLQSAKQTDQFLNSILCDFFQLWLSLYCRPPLYLLFSIQYFLPNRLKVYMWYIYSNIILAVFWFLLYYIILYIYITVILSYAIFYSILYYNWVCLVFHTRQVTTLWSKLAYSTKYWILFLTPIKVGVINTLTKVSTVCLFSCGIYKNGTNPPETWWDDWAWAKKEPITLWLGSMYYPGNNASMLQLLGLLAEPCALLSAVLVFLVKPVSQEHVDESGNEIESTWYWCALIWQAVQPMS